MNRKSRMCRNTETLQQHWLAAAPAMLALTIGMLALPVLAGPPAPTAATVPAGNATLPPPNPAIIQSGTQPAINWQTFTIAPGGTTQFVQPSGSISIGSVQPSAPIGGTLQSTGRPFQVVPNVSSPAPAVDVASAATAGKVTLSAAGGDDRVNLNVGGNGLISYQVNKTALDALVRQGHAVITKDGTVALTASGAHSILSTAVNDRGIVSANSVTISNGSVFLMGGVTAGAAP